MENKFYLKADIKLQEENEDLKKTVASVITLPKEGEKQQDLLYFTAIFVSSGANLNKAYFMPSELVKAEKTIVNKALDVEHKEEEIIGHIYDRAFIDPAGVKLDPRDLSSDKDVDTRDVHVVIAGIIYKNRFPHLSEEIAKNEWKVSMECYFRDYEVKVGDLIMSRQEAEAMGYAEETMFAKMAKVIKNGVEIAKGNIERVLRDIVFSGCGIVKNPANPPSVVLETANNKDIKVNTDDVVIFDYDKIQSINKLTSSNIEESLSVTPEKETEIPQENIEEIRSQIGPIVRAYAKQLIDEQKKNDRCYELLIKLEAKIKNTKKLL